jgi:hypothetical protein
MLAFEKIFILFGVVFMLSIPLILSLHWRRGAMRPTGDAH